VRQDAVGMGQPPPKRFCSCSSTRTSPRRRSSSLRSW